MEMAPFWSILSIKSKMVMTNQPKAAPRPKDRLRKFEDRIPVFAAGMRHGVVVFVPLTLDFAAETG